MHRKIFLTFISFFTVVVVYSIHAPVWAVNYCSNAPLTGIYTINTTCTLNVSVDGPQSGDLDIGAGAIVTLLADQALVYNSGKKISVADTAVVNLNNTTGHVAKLLQGIICITDADGDGYPLSVDGNNQSWAATTCPAGTVARAAGQVVDCNDAVYDLANSCCTASTHYQDLDGDGYGAGAGSNICDTAGWVTNNTDCNDTAGTGATVWATITGNCYLDADGDGYGTGSSLYTCGNNAACASATAASVGTGTPLTATHFATNNTDCNDSNAAIWKTVSGYYDGDGDGYGAGALVTCGANGSYVGSNNDCNDGNSSVYPGNGNWYTDGADHNCAGGVENRYGTINCSTCDPGNGHSGRRDDNGGFDSAVSCGNSGNYYISLNWGCYDSTTCPNQYQGSVQQQCH